MFHAGARYAETARLVLVNGTIGLSSVSGGRPLSVMGVTITDDRITHMYILADPDRLERLDLAAPEP